MRRRRDLSVEHPILASSLLRMQVSLLTLMTMFIWLGCMECRGDSISIPKHERITTRKDFLAEVNKVLVQMNHQQLSMDELLVRLAHHAWLSASDREVDGRIERFLKDIVENQKFRYPMELCVEYIGEGIPVNGKDLRLPPHYVLYVHLLNHTRGSVDRERIPLKITWISLMIATSPAPSPAPQKGRRSSGRGKAA